MRNFTNKEIDEQIDQLRKNETLSEGSKNRLVETWEALRKPQDQPDNIQIGVDIEAWANGSKMPGSGEVSTPRHEFKITDQEIEEWGKINNQIIQNNQ